MTIVLFFTAKFPFLNPLCRQRKNSCFKQSLIIMPREHRNELRKKIQNYSYGLSDHIDFAKKKNIFMGINQRNEEKVAIKVIDLRNKETDLTFKDQLTLEIDALKKLRHPNIIKCLDIFSTVNNCYIITQFCEGGDLQKRIKTRGAFNQAQALVIFKDLLAGYLTIAHQKFVHGSLKLSSLLLKENAVKITGFGNCKKTTKPDIKRQTIFNPYQSPESVKDNSFTHKSDIWSLGMILYVLLHGKQPWPIYQPLDIIQNCTKSYPLNPDLSAQVKDFITKTLVPVSNRFSLQQLPSHILVKKLIPNYSTQKYILGIVGNQVLEQKNKKDNQNSHLNRVQKHINCQINWMRFLFRVMERFTNIPDQPTTQILKFIVLRQLSVQYSNLKKHFDLNENAFSLTNWQQFSQDKQRMAKLRDVMHKNQPRFEKAKGAYHKLLQYFSGMNRNSAPLRGLSQLLNENFLISEYNCIFALGASTNEIKRIWQKITKQYSPKIKYDKQTNFKYKAELLLLDFVISYYQFNCLFIEDFQRQDYFEKMSKLDVILQFQPVELDASHLQQIELKLRQLTLIP